MSGRGEGKTRGMPDRRKSKNPMYRIDDIGMAAPACFFMKPSSFPAHVRKLRGGDTQRCRLIDERHAYIDFMRDLSVCNGISWAENTRRWRLAEGADR